jgi:hypothetical protein
MAYQPPKQSFAAQIFDVITSRADGRRALCTALSWPRRCGQDPKPIANPTWEALGQNATEQQQWAALGVTDPAAANDIITARFDYSFSWMALVVMAVLVIGYFLLVVGCRIGNIATSSKNASARRNRGLQWISGLFWNTRPGHFRRSSAFDALRHGAHRHNL